MPVPIVLAIFAAAGLVIGAVAAVAFWDKIIQWAHDAVFPVFQERFPSLEKAVREAFVDLNSVVGKTRKAAIQAWRQHIRPILLQEVVRFERTTDNQYMRRITSWLRDSLTESKSAIKRVVEDYISMDDLPDEVAAAFLRGSGPHEWDFTNEQDRLVREVEEAEMAM